jgi:hypothetical protein
MVRDFSYMAKRLLPTGTCWCGCGTQIELGSFFAPGHDKKAESRVIMEVFGGVPQFLVALGYGPGGTEGAGTTWITYAVRLAKLNSAQKNKMTVEYTDPENRTGPLRRTEPEATLQDFGLEDGAVTFGMPAGWIVVPFTDLLTVYKPPGNLWVVRVAGALEFTKGRVDYLASGRDDLRGYGQATMRLKELAPLKDAAMAAWARLRLQEAPGLHVRSEMSKGGVNHGFEPWKGFESAVAMLSIDDPALLQCCDQFRHAMTRVDECWFQARLQLETGDSSKPPTEKAIWWQLVQKYWPDVKGEQLVEGAREAYLKLLRHLEGLVS